MIYNNIFVTINLINYDSFIDYLYFIIQEDLFIIIISLNFEVSNIKMVVDLVLGIIKIGRNGV